jgi:alpha-tubulin suppressor-like RCC1 family protein
MSWSIRRAAVRGASLILWVTGPLLGGIACRGEDIAAPSGSAASVRPEPAVVTASTTALAFNQVSAGWQHSCGVATDNRLYCWGKNSEGELGDGTTIDRLSPVPVGGSLRFRQISAGFLTTCALTTDDRAYCWGDNPRGELGDGTTTRRLTPVPVAGGLRFRHVQMSFEHACGVSYPGNRVYCWGWNRYGQLGIGTNNGPETGNFGPYSSKPVAVAGTLSFRQVSTGYYHTCGVTTEDRVFCWGFNRDGQVGDNSTMWRRLKPTQVAGTRSFRQVDAEGEHTCAVTTGNRAFCWGNGQSGQLGNGALGERRAPTAVAGGLSFERVNAGEFQTCGETTLNRAYCWGENGNGTLGDGTNVDRLTPVPVAGGLNFKQVSAGGFHTCGRTPGAVAYCWGRGFAGQLGNGGAASSLTPVAVAGAM